VATTEPHHPCAVYREGPTGAPCSRCYPISGSRVHHPTGSPEQWVPPGPRSSICSRDTSARRLTLPQPRSSGRSCGQRSSGRTRARACCPPRRAESVIQRAVRRRQGRLTPLSGDRTERDLWVMSSPVTVARQCQRLKRAQATASPASQPSRPVPSHTGSCAAFRSQIRSQADPITPAGDHTAT
jgi:hypothetical protein